MPVPNPGTDETQPKFMARCMRWMDANESDRPQKTQLAMCFSSYRKANPGSAPPPKKDDTTGISPALKSAVEAHQKEQEGNQAASKLSPEEAAELAKKAILVKTAPDSQLLGKEKKGGMGGFFGYLAVFNNVDFQDEVIEPGAFSKSLKEHGKFPLMVRHVAHGAGVTEIVGSFTAKEDEFGLFIDATYLDTTLAQETRQKTDADIAKGLSVGYRTIQSRSGEIKGKRVTFLSELALVEGTVTIIPVNEKALITAAKSISDHALDLLRDLCAKTEDDSRPISKEDRSSVEDMLAELWETVNLCNGLLEKSQQPDSHGLPRKVDLEAKARGLSLIEARIRAAGLA